MRPSRSIRLSLRRGATVAGLALVALVAAGRPAAGQSIHPHYEQLLEKGTFALEDDDPAEAARLLRLACFGMLEAPPALADCLTRLAVAYAAGDDEEQFTDTFQRLVEVEERFGGFTEAKIPAGLRAAFETEASTRIPARVLVATPVFAALAPPPPTAEPVETTPTPPLAPAPEVDTESAAGGSEVPGELDAGEMERLRLARELLAGAADREALEEPARIAREVADANPAAKEAQHLAAVIAYRAARWQEAVRYFRQGGDPGDGAPETLFYYAVSLYETGEREAAAEALRRSLPRLEQTPFVRSYEAKILGRPPAEEAGLPGQE